MADNTDTTLNPVLTLALTRWQSANTAEEPMRKEGEKDLQFLNLEQWDAEVVSARGEARPCLTIDQIGEPYRQLVGQMRSSKPALQINPVDNGADIDTAEVFQGLIRHIEITGHAKAAREEAFKGAVGPGWGYYRLYTEFEYDDATDPAAMFDQCIKYQPIENQFSVFRDPACPLYEPWKARYALVIEAVPLDEFKARWPSAATSAADCFNATGLQMPDWYPEGSVWVADYYALSEVEDPDGQEHVQLQDGSVVPADQAPSGVPVIARRRPRKKVVTLAKITGAEILEGNDDKTDGREQPWPYIPIVPMYGEALTVKGKRTLKGIVRAARDPQRMYNYQNSELVYELALAPKSKVIMAEGQQEGYEAMWKAAPTQAFPALLYKPVALMGQPVEAPKVAQFTDPAKIQALVIAINQHKADLRSTTGWYDATDPNRKNTDQSGRAILARKEAQAEGAVNYKDAFGQSLLFEGMLLLGAIPKLWNRDGRILRLLGEDDQPLDPVTVGQHWKRKQAGIQGVFRWGAGRYDVIPSIGQAYNTRRQEAADTQMQLIEVTAKVHPPMAAAMVPSAIRNMDIPGAQDLADKAERTLPPEIRNDEEGEEDAQALQAKLQQSEQMRQEAMRVVQQLQQAIKEEQPKIEADLQKTQQDNSVKLQIEQAKIQAQIELEERKFQHEYLLAKLKIDADLEKARITAQAATQQHAHELGMGGAEAGHAARQAAQDRAHEGSQAAADRHHEGAMAERSHQHTLEADERGHAHALEQQAAEPTPHGATT